nr:hypothetical protein [Borreliella bavariensis]
MKAFKIKNPRRFSNFIRILVIVLESTRLIFFYLLRNKKINYYLILIFSFMIFFCALVFKIFLSGNK